ncbi:MAG TPA: alpha/beta hydrolase [Steroidobacteraceae bacterium]|nr:alpha/beta hydrolase [Steroidobacteraceae bacterium]
MKTACKATPTLRAFLIAMLTAASLAAGAAQPGGARHIDGLHAGGARWAIDVPADWNGTLLLYARGYGSGPIDQPPETAPRGIRDELLRKGYALGASNYSGREWAVEEAPGDQIEVLDAFVAQVGRPKRAIAWGSSMGGLVTVAMAERYPQRIAGALPMCGSVGGSLGMLNNALDGAFVFRTLVAMDPDIRVVQLDDDRANARRVQAALEAAWRTPAGRARTLLAAAMAQLPTWTDAKSPRPSKQDFDAQAEQLRRAFGMGVFVPRTDQELRAGGITSWNTGVDYAVQLRRSGLLPLVRHFYREAGLDLDADLARLAAAPRIAADARAVAYLRANYVPTGNLRVPLLTLQAVGDGVTIPAIHGGLQSIVEAAGHRRELAQLWIDGAGHCTFTPAEMFAALKTLEQRLDAGRWSVAPPDVAKRGADLPGGTRFTRYTPPPLLRACGARAGSCPGEPAPVTGAQ